MNLRYPKKTWIQFGVITGAAVLFYELGFLAFFFMVPLQFLYRMRGEELGILSSIAAAVIILILGLIRTASVEESDLRTLLMGIEIFTLFIFLGGLYISNSRLIPVGRQLYRLLIACLIAGGLSAVFFIMLERSGTLQRLLKSLFSQVLEILNISGDEAAGTAGGGFLGGLLTPDSLYEGFREAIFRFFLFLYFLLLTMTIKIGSLFRRNSTEGKNYAAILFHVPDWMIWPLIVSWGGVLLGVFVKTGPLPYVFWNTGLISLFIYGFQGVGILKYLMQKAKMQRGVQLFLNFVLVLLLIIPGINMITIFGIPALGVSEVWIKYRQRKGNTDNESNTDA
ncbi:MAG: hypothetical protein E4H36_09020 [Spirochaetales bacterium]|nr:MAG: hypothetical protein E4H36_09020 [Spirochaetales bacterium]